MTSGLTIVLNDLVETLVDLPEADIERGTAGMVVSVLTEPHRAYSVDFFVEGRVVRPTRVLLPRQLRLIREATRRRGNHVAPSCVAWTRRWRATAISRSRWRPVNPVDADGTAVKLFDVVETLVDIPQLDVEKGASGTIIEVYTEPYLGYEVEFVYEGQTDLLTCALPPSQVRLVWAAS